MIGSGVWAVLEVLYANQSGSSERSISQRFRTTAKRASDDATRTRLRPTRAKRRVDRSVASHPSSDHLTDTATGARRKHPRGGGYSSQREFGGSHEQETPHGRGAQRRVVRPLGYPKNPAVPVMRSRGIILPPAAHTPTFHARVPVISRFIFFPRPNPRRLTSRPPRLEPHPLGRISPGDR